MKILFINQKDVEGGAAIAACRLARGLEESFQSGSYFIVGKKSSANSNVFATIDSPSETLKAIKVFIEFMVNKILNFLGLQYYYFPFSTRFILKKVRQLKPDVISLHNTHGGYFKTTLIKKLSRLAPVAWTLHDMWAFTGNAAHTFGDESWKQMKSGKGEKKIYPHIGINRGRGLLKRKKRIYKKSNLHVITPSRWLFALAKQSPVFANTPLYHIPHGLDLRVFQPMDKQSCRKVLDIPIDARVTIFCSADDLDRSAWKGGSLLVDILKAIDARTTNPIETLVLGKGELKALKDLKRLNLRKIGFVNCEQLIAVLLSAADLFIYPTRADTMPLVLLEAIACGTPCITFDIGGCSDIIRDDTGGYLIKPFDIKTFADKTIEILNDGKKHEELSRSTRQFAEEHFSLETMSHAYYQLFTNIIEKEKEVK
jgi:glycosyltransferase involved in cell wall biosynthesis